MLTIWELRSVVKGRNIGHYKGMSQKELEDLLDKNPTKLKPMPISEINVFEKHTKNNKH